MDELLPRFNTNDPLYKGAILLRSVGAELAASILSCLSEAEMELMIQTMSHLGHVAGKERDRILEESEEDLRHYVNGLHTTPEYTRQILETIGSERANTILTNEREAEAPPLTLERIVKETLPETLASLVSEEHPQMIAVLVSQLPLDKAATMLTALPSELQTSVTARLVQLETPSPRALRHLEQALAVKLQMGIMDTKESPAGPRHVADILSRMRRSVETLFLTSLEENAPDLAREVQRYRFTFENLMEQEGRVLQRILRDLDTNTLPLVIKGLPEDQIELIYGNMSERAAERIREEVESLGTARLRDIEAAQQKMVNLAKSLADKGEVTLVTANQETEEEALA
ncbi:FliG C-terminal domain-containing protein [Armatimonas sp.]|uniref:flagellar motor switch protein FliG n=1 Tax=Armatimonas sp. TaxID=1872638 RepID=UPI00286AF22E|nr:FliG C-terminal domain-containing protein [Armatimonas sp.]